MELRAVVFGSLVRLSGMGLSLTKRQTPFPYMICLLPSSSFTQAETFLHKLLEIFLQNFQDQNIFNS